MTFHPTGGGTGSQFFDPSGLPGATAQSRYVGATASGPPITGTFAAGDYVVDDSGSFWVCIAAGTSGTWVQVGGSSSSAFTPADCGVLAWTNDPVLQSVSATAPGTGTIQLFRINIRQAISVTNVILAVTVAGTGLTSGQNFAGLYAGQTIGSYTAGQLIGTSADQTTPWGTTGIKAAALVSGPFAIPANTFVWVAILSNTGTSTPSFLRSIAQTATIANLGFTSPTARVASNGSGTSLPASITPASNSLAGTAFWAALS